MKRSKFTETQIIGILKEQEVGKPVADICRSYRVSLPTFYGWKNEFSGLETNHVNRIKDREAELIRYKKIVAEQMLHISVLKEVMEKNFRPC